MSFGKSGSIFPQFFLYWSWQVLPWLANRHILQIINTVLNVKGLWSVPGRKNIKIHQLNWILSLKFVLFGMYETHIQQKKRKNLNICSQANRSMLLFTRQQCCHVMHSTITIKQSLFLLPKCQQKHYHTFIWSDNVSPAGIVISLKTNLSEVQGSESCL